MVEVGRATAVLDVDESKLAAGFARARQQATAAIGGIEQTANQQLSGGMAGISGGLQKSLSGGSFANIGKGLGTNLVQGITAPFGALGNVAGSAATALGPVGIAAVAGTAAVVGLGMASSRAAMEWEAGMSQISKTTGIEKGSQAFKDLDSDLTNLYSTMPTTVSEIQSVAAAAGSLGIEKDSIAGFTNVALQMGSAFDIPAEEAAVAIGKIKGQLKSLPEGAADSADFAQKFGSAVDYVGNNFNATEKDVLEFSTRVSGSMSSLGAGAYEVAGWGGMLSSVFPSAERAAGSFDSLLTQLTTNTDSQSKAAELLGVSTDEFMQSMSTDPSDTLLNIGKAMEGLPADKLLTTAKALGGSYGMDTLVKMVGHTEEWGKAIKDTTEAGKKGESIGTSFAAGANSAKAQLQILSNSVGAIFKDIGGPINNALTPVISGVAGGLNKIRAIGENLWEPLTAGLSPVTSGISAVAGAIGDLAGMELDGLVAGAKGINSAFQTGKAFVSAFKTELTSVITGSSQFQQLQSYVEQAGTAFENAKSQVTEFLGGITSGASGAISSLTSLVSEGLSPVTDAIGGLLDSSGVSGAIGGVSDFFGRVYDKAMVSLGQKTEDAVEDGTKEGMEEGAEGAKAGITGSVSSAVNSAFDEAYSALTKAGVSKDLAGYMAAFKMSDTEALAAINRNQDYNTDVEQRGISLNFKGIPITGSFITNEGSQFQASMSFGGKTYNRTLSWPLGRDTISNAYKSIIAQASKDLGTDIMAGLTDIDKQLLEGKIDQATYNAKMALGANVEVVEVDTYLNFADNLKGEMEGAGEEINQAFLSGLTPDSAAIESRLESIRRLKFYDPEEAKRQGADNAIAYLNALKDALDSYEKAKVKYLAEPDNENARAEFDRALENLQAIADQNPLKVKVDADTSLFNTAMANVAGSIDLKKLLSDPAEFKAAVMDIPEFMANTFQPALGEQIDFFKTQWHSGIGEAQQETRDFVDAMVIAANDMPNLFSLDQIITLQQYAHGLIGVEQAIDELSAGMDKLAEKTKSASVGYDALKKSLEDTSECAISDFAQWQESQEGLFAGSYIGPGGNAYVQWKEDSIAAIAETQAAMRSVGGAVLGKDYTQTVQMQVTLDTTKAETDITALETEIKKEQEMPLQINDTQAKAAIAGIDAAASKPVTKIVYVQEVSSGGSSGNDWLSSGYGGGYNPYSGAYADYTGDFTPETGGMQGGEYWLPTFGTGDVFVPEPTLAIVGDRPGGEWIGGIDQAVVRFGGGSKAGANIVVNYSPVINAAAMSQEELAALLDEHDTKLIEKIGAELNRSQYW